MKTIILNNFNEKNGNPNNISHVNSVENIEQLEKIACRINISDHCVEILCDKNEAYQHNIETTNKPTLLPWKKMNRNQQIQILQLQK